MSRLGRIAGALFLSASVWLSGCARKMEPAAAAAQFFDRLSTGKAREAYAGSAFGFQAQQDASAFEQKARDLGLTEAAAIQWEPAVVEGRTARIRGEASLKTGKTLPLVVTLNDETGAWRVFAIKKPKDPNTGLVSNLFGSIGKGSGFTAADDLPMPEEKALREMTLETLERFNKAIQQKSFAEFYEHVAAVWKLRLTTNALQRAFQSFIDKGVKLDGIASCEPVFEPAPYINSDGLLLVSGYYPTTPYRVSFALKFTYELPRWRLFGIDVNVQD